MYIKNAIILFLSFSFFMIGLDKFFFFLEPPCSMMDKIPPMAWKVLGVMQIAAGALIWLPKIRKLVAGFFVLFMLGFTIFHLSQNTYDIGGSVFMAALLALLVWDPSFIGGKRN